jgi:hypothetical protein
MCSSRRRGSSPASPPARGDWSASGAGDSSGDSDAIYTEVLHRVRAEQEQLGQIILHPF